MDVNSTLSNGSARRAEGDKTGEVPGLSIAPYFADRACFLLQVWDGVASQNTSQL